MRRFVVLGLAAGLLAAPAVAAASPELSTSDQLKTRRYVAAGERAYVMGFQDGGFGAQGWHITGEMGGVWSQPLKLVDGVWFGIDDARPSITLARTIRDAPVTPLPDLVHPLAASR